MRLRAKQGSSLVETLVVLTIISILMALSLPTLVKVLRKAKEVAAKEAVRQEFIGRMADRANSAHGQLEDAPPNRADARSAFRRELEMGKGEKMVISELLYVVQNDDEFRAYYYTLLNVANEEPLEFDGLGTLVAYDESHNKYLLPIMEAFLNKRNSVPQLWEFVSTDLTETSSGTIGGTVLYSDGHSVYLRYPQEFPMTRVVAELSHAFMQN